MGLQLGGLHNGRIILLFEGGKFLSSLFIIICRDVGGHGPYSLDFLFSILILKFLKMNSPAIGDRASISIICKFMGKALSMPYSLGKRGLFLRSNILF